MDEQIKDKTRSLFKFHHIQELVREMAKNCRNEKYENLRIICAGGELRLNQVIALLILPELHSIQVVTNQDVVLLPDMNIQEVHSRMQILFQSLNHNLDHKIQEITSDPFYYLFRPPLPSSYPFSPIHPPLGFQCTVQENLSLPTTPITPLSPSPTSSQPQISKRVEKIISEELVNTRLDQDILFFNNSQLSESNDQEKLGSTFEDQHPLISSDLNSKEDDFEYNNSVAKLHQQHISSNLPQIISKDEAAARNRTQLVHLEKRSQISGDNQSETRLAQLSSQSEVSISQVFNQSQSRLVGLSGKLGVRMSQVSEQSQSNMVGPSGPSEVTMSQLSGQSEVRFVQVSGQSQARLSQDSDQSHVFTEQQSNFLTTNQNMHQQPHNDVILEHQFTQQNNGNLILGIDEDIIINKIEQHQYSSFEAGDKRGGISKRNKCTVCKQSFSSKQSLNRHSQVKHNPATPETVTCQHCKKIIRKENAYAHMKLHSETKHTCDICNKNFPRLTLYKYHMKSHSGVKEFKCNECDASFTLNTLLNKHIKIHQSKQFKCRECDKEFITSVKLNRHMKAHADDKPFQCTECPSVFNRNDNMKKHMKKAHNMNLPDNRDKNQH